MLKLYGVARSRTSRAIWLLEEAGIKAERVPVQAAWRLKDPAAAGAPLNTASPAYRAVNPMGQIPALEDDGTVLTESLAIVLHLARRHGGAIGPRDWREDAAMLNWVLFAATAIEPLATVILYVGMEGRTDTPAGKAELAATAEKLARPFARLEAHLAGAEWLVGGRFTAAEVAVAECLRYVQSYPPAFAAFPRLSAWLARCQARPGFQAMLAARNAEPE
ncbi:MAG: glutathione S-transferase family protein [Rhodobacteraceae bacterium]|nr:glutathione S-transferase family protein [Paracoccaceae bacterium]